jgi:hypothetical protein
MTRSNSSIPKKQFSTNVIPHACHVICTICNLFSFLHFTIYMWNENIMVLYLEIHAAEVRFEISNGSNKKNTHFAPGALKGILLFAMK